jgi:CheY-like chemotaxis protein
MKDRVPAPGDSCDRRECSLLLVEDNEADVDLLLLAFEQRGYHANINTFRQGDKAWKHLEQLMQSRGQPPDIILLDDQVPVVSGCELFKRIEAHPYFASSVLTIFSAKQPEQLARQGVRPDAIIPKPSDWAGYGAVFDRVLDLLKQVPCSLRKLDSA